MDLLNQSRAAVDEARVELDQAGSGIEACNCVVRVKDAAHGDNGESRIFDDEFEDFHRALADGNPAEAAGLKSMLGNGGVIDGCVGCDEPGEVV